VEEPRSAADRNRLSGKPRRPDFHTHSHETFYRFLVLAAGADWSPASVDTSIDAADTSVCATALLARCGDDGGLQNAVQAREVLIEVWLSLAGDLALAWRFAVTGIQHVDHVHARDHFAEGSE
jgi:hypothetical protein